MRREIPLFLTMIFGCFMVIEFFVPHPFVSTIGQRLKDWTIVVAAAAVVLGVANVARIHLKKISRRDQDWPFSIPLLFGIALMLFLGVLPASFMQALGFGIGGIESGSPFDWIYNNAYVPMQGTMFALLAFFIASAAFRAFRIRKLDAALLAITAIFVMIGRVPLGEAIWSGLPTIQDWIMNVPNLAAKRAILIGAALGAISTSMKIVLGIERSAIGGE